MSTLTLQTEYNQQKTNIPVTARGRALYTTDWFLNGRPASGHHDNPRMTLRNDISKN